MKVIRRKGRQSNRYKYFIFLSFFIFQIKFIEATTWKGNELLRQWSEAPWRIGPFKMQPMLLLTNAGYDDNIYYHSRDNPIKDYTLTAGPAANIYLSFKRKILFMGYASPQYVYFHETKRERTWNYYGRAEINFIFNRFLLMVGASYADARERWNTEIDIRPRRRERSGRAEFFWQLGHRLSLSLGTRQSQYEYENLEYERFRIADQLNRTENYVNVATYLELTPRVRFFLDAEYGLFEFAHPASRRDSQSYALYTGLEFSPLGKIRGRLHYGYKYFDSKAPEKQDYRGLVGDTSLQVRLLRRLWVRGALRRDVRFSLWYENTYFLENIWSTGFSLYLHRKIRLDYDYTNGRNRYPQPSFPTESEPAYLNSAPCGPSPPSVSFLSITLPHLLHSFSASSPIKRRDDYQIHSVAIYYRLGKDVGLGLIFSHWSRDSNLDWEDDRRNFIGLNLTYSF